jgi:hypothetical protein
MGGTTHGLTNSRAFQAYSIAAVYVAGQVARRSLLHALTDIVRYEERDRQERACIQSSLISVAR